MCRCTPETLTADRPGSWPGDRRSPGLQTGVPAARAGSGPRPGLWAPASPASPFCLQPARPGDGRTEGAGGGNQRLPGSPLTRPPLAARAPGPLRSHLPFREGTVVFQRVWTPRARGPVGPQNRHARRLPFGRGSPGESRTNGGRDQGRAPSASPSSVTARQHVIPSPTSGLSSRHCGSPRQLPKQPHSSYLFPGQPPVSGARSTPVHGGHKKEGAGGPTDGKPRV